MSVVDTIVALATPAGVGRRAVVRLSGPRAWQALRDALRSVPELEARRLLAARLPLGVGAELPVELMLWSAPRSATGEQLAEIHLPAWPSAVAELLRLLCAAGCRPAERGEFTRRAVLLGKLDVDRAMALGALTHAADAPAAQAALDTLIDGSEVALNELREALLATLALLEAHVDHEADDTEALALGELPSALSALSTHARELAARSASQLPFEGELEIVLLGPPNAGKSSLMLALCPAAQTTSSPVPGTTRDALHARLQVADQRLRFIDGPGVSWEHTWEDPLDARAMQQFLAQLPARAIVLDLEDATQPSSLSERERRRVAAGQRARLEVSGKSDLQHVASDRLLVSSESGAGLDELLAGLLKLAPPAAPLSARQVLESELLQDLSPLLQGFSEALPDELAARGSSAEERFEHALSTGALPLVALALREAVERLDAHAQRSSDLSEELLDRVFAGFCLGK